MVQRPAESESAIQQAVERIVKRFHPDKHVPDPGCCSPRVRLACVRRMS